MFPEGRIGEFLIVAVVALVFVGPKDLPVLLRKLGQFMAKVRSMAAEFRASFDEMARQSELDELRKEVEAMRSGQLTDIATHAPEVNQTFNEISQGLADVGVSFDSPAYPYVDPHAGAVEPAPVKAPRARKASAKKAPAKAAAAKKTATPRTVAAKRSAPKAAAPKAATPKAAAAKAAPTPRGAVSKSAPAKAPPAKAKAASAKPARKATIS